MVWEGISPHLPCFLSQKLPTTDSFTALRTFRHSSFVRWHTTFMRSMIAWQGDSDAHPLHMVAGGREKKTLGCWRNNAINLLILKLDINIHLDSYITQKIPWEILRQAMSSKGTLMSLLLWENLAVVSADEIISVIDYLLVIEYDINQHNNIPFHCLNYNNYFPFIFSKNQVKLWPIF